MDFPPFAHAAWLAQAWQHGPPRHNLGASGFQSPLLSRWTGPGEEEDIGMLDLHAGTDLRDRLATRAGVAPDQVRVTAGTSGANLAAIASLVSPGSNVVCERPTYMPLASMAAGFGAEVRWVERASTWDLEAVAAACDTDTAAILCTSPNNPTGKALDAQQLRRLGDIAAQHDAWVVVDQVYRELTDHPLGGALHPRIISTAGLNKCWGAPGLRVGWALGDGTVMERIEATHRTLALAPSRFGTRIALRMLDDEADARRHLEDHLRQAHQAYGGFCEDMGLDDAAAGLVAFPAVPDSQATAEALAKGGVLTVPGEAFGAPGHLRIGLGIGLPALQAGLGAMQAALQAQRF